MYFGHALIIILALKTAFTQKKSISVSISELQKPITHRISLMCNSSTIIQFQLLQQMPANAQPLMLRLDYEPNKCIFAAQDILLTGDQTNNQKQQNNKKVVQVNFEKKCCNLNNNDIYEYVRLVVTLRQAYGVNGFPIPKLFIDVTIVVMCALIAIIIFWVVVQTVFEEKGKAKKKSGMKYL